jgi:hypothetical protein
MYRKYLFIIISLQKNIHLVTIILLSLQPIVYCTMYSCRASYRFCTHQNNSGVKTEETAPAKLDRDFKHLLYKTGSFNKLLQVK